MNTVVPSEHVVLSACLQNDPGGYRHGGVRYKMSAKVRGWEGQGVELKLKLSHYTHIAATVSVGAHQPRAGRWRTKQTLIRSYFLSLDKAKNGNCTDFEPIFSMPAKLK